MGCIALVVAGVLYMQRGAHIDLPGKILKVRTAPLDENSSIVVFDFRITNPADYTLVVRTVTVAMEDPEATGPTGRWPPRWTPSSYSRRYPCSGRSITTP